MITVDQYMDIKQRLANGQSLHSIASDTGHSRNTVRRIQRSEHPLQKPKPAKPRPTRAQKLDPYRDYIRSRVEQFDLDATRILPEIQAMGYTGGVHTVRRYIRQLKQRTKLLSQATVRFETPPAKQAQCDWAHVGKFPDPSGKLIDIYVFVIVLSYSRQMFIRFTTSMKLPTLIECHQAAFDYFQGVPQERNQLHRQLNMLMQPKVLLIDEVGYLQLDRVQSSLLFQVICNRYERGQPIMVTSNKAFGQWASVFADDAVMASAALDRLLHRCTVVNIRGDSYRLREKRRSGSGITQTPTSIKPEQEGGTNREHPMADNEQR